MTNVLFSYKFGIFIYMYWPSKDRASKFQFPSGLLFNNYKCLSYFWCLNWCDFFFFNIKVLYYKSEEKGLPKSVLHACDVPCTCSLHISRQKNQMHNTRINYSCVHVYSWYVLVYPGCFNQITLDWVTIKKHKPPGTDFIRHKLY